MTLLTLTIPTLAYAQAMSAALWSLARPGTSDATRYAVTWITHPTTGEVAIELTDDYRQRVDAAADVAAFVAALGLPAGEAATLTATLEGARGGAPLTVIDWLPATLAARTLTEVAAAAAGWFDEV